MLRPGLLQAVGMPKVLLFSGRCSFSVQDVFLQGRTQLAQRAMSAHDMGVEVASHEGLSTLETGSNSHSWHATSEPPLDFATSSESPLQLLAFPRLSDVCTTVLQHQEDQMHFYT